MFKEDKMIEAIRWILNLYEKREDLFFSPGELIDELKEACVPI